MELRPLGRTGVSVSKLCLGAPGTNINPADGGWAYPALQPEARRRQGKP
jgi:aryl-alcohol dehydrogenase-like predicted oxidoreductase